MSKKFKIPKSPWDDYNIYKKSNIEIQPGVTVLVGCNGFGKTTLLRCMKENLNREKIPMISYDNVFEGGLTAISKAGFENNLGLASTLMLSSEGEQLYQNIGQMAGKIGRFIRDNKNVNELWILFDAIDSGLSVDNIIEIKDFLFNVILEDTRGQDVYIICTANSYEMCKDLNCFDVYNGRYITFKDYEDYRKFILNSRKEKDKRYE